jgi:hypothetical protein
VHPEVVKDIARMSWLFFQHQQRLLSQKVYLNPDFTRNGFLLGAEPDLFANGCVIDVKTTAEPIMPASWIYQILAYVLTDTSDSWHIGGVGFYLPRQAQLVQWPLRQFLPMASGSSEVSLKSLRQEFYQVLLAARRG